MYDSILNGIYQGTSGITNGLFNGLFFVLRKLVDIFLLPINGLITAFFPSFNLLINNFTNSLTLIASAPISFFMHLLPPITQSVLIFWVGLMISYYSFIWIYRGIIIIPAVIRKIKFW